MVYEDRWYQVECEDALLNDVISSNHIHPLAAVPTAAGKTKIMGSFIYKLLEVYPTWDILILSHTENILIQDYEALEEFFPGINIGLYSSGLGSKTIKKLTVAGIQSVYRQADKFHSFKVALIDEAHTVPTIGNGMYQQFFNANPDIIRVGLTATHFRMGHGLLHEGEGRMFNKLSYDLSSMENFNRLTDEGYLAKLLSKPAEMQLDTKGIKLTASDFNQKDMSQRFDRDTITEAAVKEIVRMGKNYKSWLIFAIDIAHCDHIRDELLNHGISAESLHSRGESSKQGATARFKRKEIRALVSVGMITTGFNARNVDLLVLLRPTKSPVLHVQMIGRGLRPYPGKDHCLVLDFAGNVGRLGPINAVQIPHHRRPGGGDGEAIVKSCPVCGCQYHPSVKICEACGHEFEFQESINTTFSEDEVVATSQKRWLTVSTVLYSIHEKMGSPDSLKVTYKCGLSTVSEYICFNHSGWAKRQANNWVMFRWTGSGFPLDVHQLFRDSKYLKKPNQMQVDFSGKYPQIKDVKF